MPPTDPEKVAKAAAELARVLGEIDLYCRQYPRDHDLPDWLVQDIVRALGSSDIAGIPRP